MLAPDPPAARPSLQVRGLRAAYDNIEALHGVDLTVAAGTVFAILGPNGAGKTTLLRVLAGLMTPSAGTVHMEGVDVTATNAQQLARAGVCLIPEGRGIFPNLTVAENILMDTFATKGADVAQLEADAYGRFPRLAERGDQMAGTLSGGEQQMLSLARALTTDPALILIDELSMGLAPTVVVELFQIVQNLARTGITTVIVEQFAGVAKIADQVAILRRGVVHDVGDSEEMVAQLSGAYLGVAP